MTSPAYWEQIVSELEDPARAEHAAHVLVAGLPGRIDQSNVGPALAAVGVAKLVENLLCAVTVDEDAFPYVVQVLSVLPPADVLATLQSTKLVSAAAKEAVRVTFQGTAPEHAHKVI